MHVTYIAHTEFIASERIPEAKCYLYCCLSSLGLFVYNSSIVALHNTLLPHLHKDLAIVEHMGMVGVVR